jgi:transposase
MARGPKITEEEISKAKAMQAEGKSVKAIASELKRSLPTVYKLLRPIERPEV